MRRLTILLVLAILMFSSCFKEKERESEPLLVLRYADNQPEYYPTTKAARHFADLVKERTGGKIEIRVYSNGELGNERSVFQQVQFGGIDLSRCSLGILSDVYPQIGMLQLPYLYNDSTHMWRVLDGDVGDMFLSGFSTFHAVGLCWFDAGARSFYTRSPVKSLSDMQGMTIRVQENELMSDIVRLLGVTPVQIPYGEVYSALQMMRIDGAENNMPSYVFMEHDEAAPYFFVDEHIRLPEVLVMSEAAKEKIKKVDPSFLVVMQDCAKETGRFERSLWQQAEKDALENMKAEGCVITWPADATLDEFKKAMKPIYDKYTGEEALLIEKIRKE